MRISVAGHPVVLQPLGVLVLDGEGNPVPEARVAARAEGGWAAGTAEDPLDGLTQDEATTDAEGRCVLWLGAGGHDVQAEHDDRGSTTPRFVQLDAEATAPELWLPMWRRHHEVAGVVRHADGRPAAGAVVEQARFAHQGRPAPAPAIADDQGRFSWTLETDVFSAHLSVRWQDREREYDVFSPFADIEVVLPEAVVTVSGRVVGPDGVPVPRADVAWQPANHAWPSILIRQRGGDRVMTDTQGRFALPLDSPGEHLVEVSARRLVLVGEHRERLEGTADHDIGELKLTAGAVLSGLVLDEQDQPARAAQVVLVSMGRGFDWPPRGPGGSVASWPLGETVKTDSQGRFGYEGLLPGEVYRLAAASGWTPDGSLSLADPIEVRAGDEGIALQLHAPPPVPPRSVELIVAELTSGRPVTAVDLTGSLTAPSSRGVQRLASPDGCYTLAAPATGALGIQLLAPGLRPWSVHFGADEPLPERLEVLLEPVSR